MRRAASNLGRRKLAKPRASGGQNPGLLTIGTLLILPFTQLIQFQGVGTLYLHDLIAPAILAILVVQQGVKRLKPVFPALALAFVWLVGAVITDIHLETPYEDFIRGWSRIILFAINIAMIWILSRGNIKYLSMYLFSVAVTMALRIYLIPDDVSLSDPWKFGVGGGIIFSISAIGTIFIGRYPKLKFILPLLILFVSLLSLWQNSRSLFAIGALAAAYSTLSLWIAARPALADRVTPTVFAGFVGTGILAAQAISAMYSLAARSGSLGAAAMRKYYQQAAGDVSLLVGGRPESLVSIQAILDSPVLGHGSWAKDSYYTRLLFVRMKELGVEAGSFESYVGRFGFLIPTHSHLLGAWVEAGILGAPIWIYGLILAVRVLYRTLRWHGPTSALLAVVAFFCIWDILFSPFGADARIVKAVQICILLSALKSLPRPMRKRRAPAGHMRPHSRSFAAS